MTDKSQSEKHKVAAAVKEFAVEIINGTVIFFLIACAAIALSFFVVFLESKDVDIVVIVGLKIAKYAIFFTDLLLFGRFLFVNSVRTWKSI